ncbi:MarR family winged helix-turn-helix transcriptional regulator [Anaerotignum propionicum]|uniref:DNA-binding transcriptional regulator, MarR family n=1 Tax=Anaerotignum propionicum DSM 1682 TaxID=991789 RepID=A0A0X1U727_ANAPI|nr:MarR family transcriptional regulator [Anaerotignum propionicum]AMJ40739.1 MarR family protein [Anaerotignum propionicum DSM 1682]SHF08542.1 DNA-binding transcriptional regulator, MarR family [[Clostridium] propionicum DSM 1682] [Anaerotignum propionicum DSM 1682]
MQEVVKKCNEYGIHYALTVQRREGLLKIRIFRIKTGGGSVEPEMYPLHFGNQRIDKIRNQTYNKIRKRIYKKGDYSMDDVKAVSTALDRLYRKQGDLYHEYASYYGLSDIAFWILYTLCGADETYTQNQIADLWHFPRQSVNSAVSSLVKEGYIFLEKLTVARNNKALRLTEQGVEFCQSAIFPFYEMENRIFNKMSEDERNQFFALSAKQCELLEQEIKAALMEK